jgi:hypothetical protein
VHKLQKISTFEWEGGKEHTSLRMVRDKPLPAACQVPFPPPTHTHTPSSLSLLVLHKC